MIVTPDGKTGVFLHYARALQYAVERHGYVVNMFGQDDAVPDMPVADITTEIPGS